MCKLWEDLAKEYAKEYAKEHAKEYAEVVAKEERAESKKEIAVNMLKEKCSIELISKVTNLNIEEIKKLAEKNPA